jgi:exodeoxyribonuclease-3
MKLISWNVNGIRACVQKGFLDFFQEADADIFCIQESKMQEGQLDLELEGYQYDRQKSVTSGQNCYVKAQDHSIDAERYLISEWQSQGKLLII